MTNQPTPSITIGKTDLHTAPLGIGTMTWGDTSFRHRFHPAQMAYGPADGLAEERNAVDASLAAGVTLFDTAAAYSYGASEERVGEVTEGKKILIATKFPGKFLLPKARQLPGTLNRSLKRLRHSPIDLYQVHFPSRTLDIPQVLNLMADAVQEGKVRAVGVSNYSADEMKLAYDVLGKRGIPLASNQVQYSLLFRKPEIDGVMDACRELGVTLIAYMPLAMGALTGKYAGTTKPAGLRRFMGFFRKKETNDLIALLTRIGEAHGKSAPQAALRWLIQQGNVIPIPGAKNGAQAAHNAGALTFSLTDAEVATLGEATQRSRSKRGGF
jgi:aryl-alcohol dehydrogenase-like predicted oxidoreductase